jgi:hypothetical protein
MKIPENLKNDRGVIELEKSELIFKDGRCYVAGPLIKPPIINMPDVVVGKLDGEDWAIQQFGKEPKWRI